MYNRVILIGRLVADPERSFTPSEKSVCKLRMAVDGAYAGQDGRKESVFVNVTVWNKQGQSCANYLAVASRFVALSTVRLIVRLPYQVCRSVDYTQDLALSILLTCFLVQCL